MPGIQRAIIGFVCASFAFSGRSAQEPRHVQVSVTVHNLDGDVVGDLTRDDFKIDDEGRPRPISDFRIQSPPTKLQRQRPPRVYTVSNKPGINGYTSQPATVLLLDTKNTDPVFQPWMVAQAARLLSYLGSGQQLAVYQLRSDGLHQLHAFSANALHLLVSFAPATISRTSTGYKLDLSHVGIIDKQTQEELEREVQDITLRKRRQEETAHALAELGLFLREIPGRKNILWMSGDFLPLFDVKGDSSETKAIDAAARALDAANVALFPTDVRGHVVPETPQDIAHGEEATIPADRRKLLPPNYQDVMKTIASNTGGAAIFNKAQLAESMVDNVSAARFSYLLTFDVPESEWNGSLHRLKLHVNGRGLRVVARSAYYAAAAPEIKSAPHLDNPDIGLTAFFLPGELHGSQITIELLVDGSSLEAVSGSPHTFQASLQQIVGSGKTAGQSPPAMEKEFTVTEDKWAQTRSNGLHIWWTFNLEPATRELKITFQAVPQQRTGTLTVPVDFLVHNLLDSKGD